jgi:hypothetical protein
MIQFKHINKDEIIFEMENHIKIPRKDEIVFLPTADIENKNHPKYKVINVHYYYNFKRMSRSYEDSVIVYVELEE